MYITDLRHFLDDSGSISMPEGPARAIAQFNADVVANASNAAGKPPDAPRCFKCKKAIVQTGLARDSSVLWTCPHCAAAGRISNWRGTLWDLCNRPVMRA